MRPFRPAVALALLATLAPGAAAEHAPRRNLLLISLDSVRRDLLGCYGYASPLARGLSPSPVLDRLAADGVRMDSPVNNETCEGRVHGAFA
jgi:hypothetical protein